MTLSQAACTFIRMYWLAFKYSSNVFTCLCDLVFVLFPASPPYPNTMFRSSFEAFLPVFCFLLLFCYMEGALFLIGQMWDLILLSGGSGFNIIATCLVVGKLRPTEAKECGSQLHREYMGGQLWTQTFLTQEVSFSHFYFQLLFFLNSSPKLFSSWFAFGNRKHQLLVHSSPTKEPQGAKATPVLCECFSLQMCFLYAK